MERVLLAPLGDSDPVRYDFDGPVLHIVRHYRPRAVYLLINKRFEERDRRQDTYARLIKMVMPECTVEKRYTGIADPSDFDAFTALVRKELDEISARHPSAEILLNVTSGTPQMISSICLEAVSGRYRCRPVQVKTPRRDSNVDVRHLTGDETAEEIWEGLLDNLPEAENRCVEPQIFGFRRSRLSGELRGMLSAYDYLTVHKVIEENPGFFPQEAALLARHAWLRSNLKSGEAEKLARECAAVCDFDLYPVKNQPAKKIVEYYLIFEIKRKKSEMADFFMRLSPLCTELAAVFLERFYRLDRGRLLLQDDRGVPYYSLQEIKKLDPGLADWLGSQVRTPVYVNNREVIFYSLENSLRMCRYYSTEVKSHDRPQILNMLDRFEKLRLVERDVRNRIAHEITSFDEQMLKEATGGWDSERISREIRRLLKEIFGREVNEEAFSVYERINRRIEEFIT